MDYGVTFVFVTRETVVEIRPSFLKLYLVLKGCLSGFVCNPQLVIKGV